MGEEEEMGRRRKIKRNGEKEKQTKWGRTRRIHGEKEEKTK